MMIQNICKPITCHKILAKLSYGLDKMLKVKSFSAFLGRPPNFEYPIFHWANTEWVTNTLITSPL